MKRKPFTTDLDEADCEAWRQRREREGREAKRAIEEWAGQKDAPGMWWIFGVLAGGFVGIVLLGIGASFWVSVLFDVPPPARAEKVEEEPGTERITAEEIEGRNRHARVER